MSPDLSLIDKLKEAAEYARSDSLWFAHITLTLHPEGVYVRGSLNGTQTIQLKPWIVIERSRANPLIRAIDEVARSLEAYRGMSDE